MDDIYTHCIIVHTQTGTCLNPVYLGCSSVDKLIAIIRIFEKPEAELSIGTSYGQTDVCNIETNDLVAVNPRTEFVDTFIIR